MTRFVLLLVAISLNGVPTLSGAEPRELKGHTGAVHNILFSPDGKTLASVGREGYPEPPRVGFNFDLAGAEPIVKLWDVKTGKVSATIHGGILLSFNPDSSVIAVDEALWDTKTGKKKEPPKAAAAEPILAFSKDWSKIVKLSTPKQHTIFLDTTTGKELQVSDNVCSVALGQDGKTLASHECSPGGCVITILDVGTGKKQAKLTDKDCHSGIFDGRVLGEMMVVFPGVFSPDGKTLVTGSDAKLTKLWDVETGNKIRTITSRFRSVHSAAFSPDSKTLASGTNGVGEIIELRDTKTGRLSRLLKADPEGEPVLCVAFSPDGGTLASGSIKSVRLWDTKTGKLQATLKGHDGAVNCLAFSPDGKTLASGGDDKSVMLWDVTPAK